MAQVEKRAASLLATFEWEYAPAPEARDIVTLRERYGLFIGGEYVEPRSGTWFPTTSPATEESLAEVAQAGPEDVDLAVSAARAAFEDGWSSLRPAACSG
jgi:aldehyde dehydrogenase (NAD+)